MVLHEARSSDAGWTSLRANTFAGVGRSPVSSWLRLSHVVLHFRPTHCTAILPPHPEPCFCGCVTSAYELGEGTRLQTSSYRPCSPRF
jgi:hypothetical protein